MESQDKNVVSVLFVAILTFIVWHRVLGQALIAEGPTYFTEPYASMIANGGISSIAQRHDVQALLFFHFFANVFTDNMQFYMGFLLLGTTLVNLSLFWLVYKVSKSALAASFASVFFISNYVGSFEMLGTGYYQWFIQRVPNFALGLLALLFLVQFFRKKRNLYFWLSLFSYLLALFLAHFTLLALPLFVLYPLSNVFVKNRRKAGQYAKALVQVLPFIFGSYFLVRDQGLKAEEGVFQFIQNRPTLVEEVFREITLLTVPPDIIRVFLRWLNELDPNQFLNFSLPEAIRFVIPFVVLFYVTLVLAVYKFEKALRPFLLTLALSLPIVTFFSIYLNPYFVDLNVSSRYLYFPSMVLGMLWGMILYSLIRRGEIYKLFIGGLLLWWFVLNQQTILRHFDVWQEKHDAVLSTISFVQKNNDEFPDRSIVVVPGENGYYGATMLERFHGQRGVRFIPETIFKGPDSLEKDKTYIFLKKLDSFGRK